MKLKLYLLVGLFLIHFSMLGTPSKMNEDRFANYLNVLTVPEPPTAISPQIYAGTATLAALTATGTNLQWYAALTGGDPLVLTTALVDGTTYYVSQTSGSEESKRTPVTAKKISEVTQTLCGATLSNLTSTASTHASVKWFTDATGGTALDETAAITSGNYYVEQQMPQIYTVASNLGSGYQYSQIANDALGNIYISEMTIISYNEIGLPVYSESLKKMNSDGTNVQTLATGSIGIIKGFDVDALGNIFYIDTYYDKIIKMNNNGDNVQVFANGFQGIQTLSIDPSGIFNIVDYWNKNFIKVNASGTIIEGSIPYSISNQDSPFRIKVDALGNIFSLDLYFTFSKGIKRRNNDGSYQILSNGQVRGIELDSNGKLYYSEGNSIKKMNIDGTDIETVTNALYSPSGISIDAWGVINVFDYNQVKKILPQPYTSNRVLVNVIVEESLEAPTVTTPLNYNQNETASALTATSGGSSLLWYTTATAGTGSATAPTPDTTIGGGTSYWVSSVSASGCESERTEIKVIIPMQVPTAINTQIYAGTATIANLTATGVNLNWYADDTGGEPLAVTTALVDETTYYVSQTSGSVESDRIAVTVKRISKASQTFCSYSGATVADIVISPSPDATVEWFTTATEGTALEGTAVLSSGSYYVAQTHTENTTLVTSNRVLVNVVIETVQMPTAVSPINHVQGVVATALTTTSGGTKLWYITATGGEGSQEAPIPSTATVGSTSYWVAAVTTNGCESERLEIIVNINEQVPATHLHLDGVNDHVTLPSSVSNALSGGTEVTIEYWFKGNKVQSAVRFQNNNGFIVAGWGNSGGNSQFIISTDGSTNGVSCGPLTTVEDNTWHHLAMVWKKNTIFATYLDGVLQSSRVAANVNLPVFTGNVGFLGSYYANGEYTKGNLEDVRIWNVARTANQISSSKNCELNGTETGLIAYYKFNQGINAGNNALESTLVDATSNANNATITNLALTGEGSNFLSGSPVVSGIVVTGQATVTTPINYYQNETATPLTATSAGTGLLWYTTATGGSGSIDAPTPETATIGNTSYWVSSTSEIGCESARTEIVVTITVLENPVVKSLQIYAGSATIANLTATGTNLQWYTDATDGAALASTTILMDGATYYVSQSSGSQESNRTAVTVRKICEASQTFCSNSGPTVADLVNSPSADATVKWFTTASANALAVSDVLVTGAYYIEQTLLDNTTVVTSNRVLVNVVVEVSATPSVTSPISYVQGTTASALTATTEEAGLVWYTTETGGMGSTTAPIPSTATVGTTYYWVASTNANGCESTRTEIVVNTTAFVLTITNHPEAITIAGGQNTSFTATVNSNSANYQWQVSHDGGSTFTDLTNDGIYSGVTSASLTLTNVPISMHGKQYKVKVSNGSEVVSNAAALAVTVPTFNNERFWKNRGTAGFSASDADYSVTALDANNMPYVAFADGANSDKATVMKFNGTSWDIVGTAGFSTSSNVYNFSIVFDASNMPYVAYVGGNNLIEVKHFNGTSWTNVGTSGLANQAEGLSFALDASGTPYVAYVDYGANYKTTVRKLVANAWVLVGNAGFTAGESYDTSFAIDEQGTPYVVYRDDSNDGKATAMKFNGSAWVSVGPASGFSPDVAFYTSLSIDRAGTPYATFVDFYTDQPVVMKFNGSEWVMVGTPGFASGVLYSSSIALDGSGTPFIVYQDFDNNDKVTVKRFNGTSWTTVGEPGFSMGATTYTSLDVDASGTPYVGFIDASMGNKVTVMKFNGSNVETIWENGSWDNGVPSFTMKAIIDDTLVLSTDLQASALEVTTNGSITVATGTVLTVSGKIINNNTPAHFVVEDHGILLQQQDIQNEGPITVNVNSFPLYRQDYTLWSSPVENQNLRSFSLQTLFNRFSSYNTAAGTGANPVGAYVQEIFTTADMATKTFTTANGYLIRMPNNWDEYVTNTIPGVSYPGVFKGVPQNGAISRALSTSNVGMNLVGNPYPSPISIDAFFDGNPDVEQTIYYWRKRNDATGSGYATLNVLGFVSAQSEINNLDMEYVINPGQGFFVKTTGATQLNFNNTMRSSNTEGLFLRNAPQEKHRLWLGLSNSTGSVGQTLIGYTAGATENADNGLDAAYFNDSATALTSLIDGNEYAIQGRSLPFSTTDSVPLGFKSATNGAYTIALSNFDGLFATEQAVFLKDNTTGSVTNLKLSDYSFTTPAGVFNSRFELRYDSTLNTNNPQDLESQILIASKNNTITINAGTAIMEKIELYDVSGRLLFKKSGIDKSIETLENLTAANQVLLVKVTTQDKVSVTKKIVY